MTLHAWREELTRASRATGTRFTSVTSAGLQDGRPTLHRGQTAAWRLACQGSPAVTVLLFDERTGQHISTLPLTAEWRDEAVSVEVIIPDVIRPGPYCVVFEGVWDNGGRAGAEVSIDVAQGGPTEAAELTVRRTSKPSPARHAPEE